MYSGPPPESVPGARANAALGAFGTVLALAWVVLIAYCIQPVLPYNSVRLPGGRSLNALLLAPQGWGFFTRSPREERQFVFGRGPDGWRPLLRVPHARLANTLGLNRKSRAQGVEMGLLLQEAPTNGWQACEDAVAACLNRLPRGQAARNVSPNPTLCGTVAVVLQEPVPWAWLPSSPPVQMPSRMIALEAEC
jgi:antimicrobial peptide system SdpA family protein